MNQFYSIKVRAQLNEKVIDGDLKVKTNKYIESYKLVKDLKAGDSFIYDGVWYDVQAISPL